jgi:glycosyltransferase involved in cell wall biosynthesis
MEIQNKISAVIITFNEEKNIANCLDSLKEVADEIIVVDSFSTDSTESICKEKLVKFVQNPFEGHIQQKNYAMKLASHLYVLSLDADEALDEQLKKEILKVKSNLTSDAYSFNRLNNFCGQWIWHCGWYPDVKIRLWNKNNGFWGGENPHDKIMMNENASIQHLKGNLLHYSFRSVSEHIKQIQFFTDISSKAAFNSGKKTTIAGIIIKPAFKFFRDYILKAGFLDGFYGFVISINSAHATFLKYAKLYELQQSKKKDSISK